MKSLLSLAGPVAAFVIALFGIVWLYMYLGLHLPPPIEPPREGGMESFAVINPPRNAPDMAFQRSDGKKFRVADFKGRVVVVNFWATWCAPCVRELPALTQLTDLFDPTDVMLLPINVDRKGAEVAEPFLEEHEMTDLPLFLDPKMALAQAFGVKKLPATFVVDRKGQILGNMTGFADWSTPAAEKLVNFYAALER